MVHTLSAYHHLDAIERKARGLVERRHTLPVDLEGSTHKNPSSHTLIGLSNRNEW